MAKAEIGPTEVKWDRDNDGDPIVFEVEPADWFGVQVLEEAMEVPGNPADGKVAAQRLHRMVAVAVEAVTTWRGVFLRGQPAECDEANKRRFFASPRNLDALVLVTRARAHQGEPGDADRPNASGGGSGSSDATPASNAGNITPTDSTAQTTLAAAGGGAGG